jgi:Carboxypeptidase regulatory-like domain/TonB dependent receptor
MRAFTARRLCVLRLAAFAALVFGLTATALGQAQSNAADLQGYVRDPAGAVIANATVTARNKATGIERSAQTNDEGFYKIVSLPPGDYEVTVEAANFSRASVPDVALTVGQRADLDIPLQAGQVTETVTVTGATTEVIETSRTAVANTIERQRIENLPINERSYLNFALTTSTVTRDNARPIGPAPTSGLNFGGQRGRSNLVQVDGADNTDNSVNAARSTVGQEAVQEFQVVSNSYMPEFGRTSGGVVNVVTKSGTNDWNGNVFGFIRHKSIQARNPFAPLINNDPEEKPPFTRAQYGVTLGGPFDRDRTFGFFAFEQRRRQESGFFTSDVDANLTSSITIPVPGLGNVPFTRLRPEQVTYIQALLGSGIPAIQQAAIQYAFLASSGGNTGLFGTNPLPNLSTTNGIPVGATVGQRFILAGTPVPVSPIAFRPLTQLQQVFPISERTTFSSARLDHRINDDHLLAMRFGYNPSDITGIQVESQNQALGQNDFSRTGIQNLRDATFVTTLNSTLSASVVNEARFQFGQRRAVFKSQNGEAVAFNISGTAFIGRELFSPVVRTENRYQFTDNVNWIVGNHSFKFGGDANFISVNAIFELNFAGLYNFGGLSGCTLIAALCALPSGLPAAPPDFSPVQQYGIGFPNNYIQGFGNPFSKLNNRPYALFAQDSWKIRPNLTFNYGVRYDYEETDQIAPVDFRDPLTGITLTSADLLRAQDALNIQQGFPRDKDNFAPRVGVAWDLFSDQTTVLRAAYGIFYDHPLLAVAFNSDIADAAQQQQFVALPNLPTPTVLLNATQIFQGTVIPCTPGRVPGVTCTPGTAGSAVYQLGRQRFDDQTFPGFGPVLPFTLPVSKDFEYAYANQANVSIERQLTRDMSFTASWLFVGAHHLPHPTDINAPRTDLQIANFARLAGRNPVSTTEAIAFSIPTTGVPCPGGVPLLCFTVATPTGTPAFPNAGQTFALIVPGMIAAPLTNLGSRVITPAIANFFRPSGPNYFLAAAASGGLVTPGVLNSQLGGTLRAPGLVAPFGSINAQVSDGNSVYHAGNFELRRRFASNFQFLASYTWSHAIDDSSDLQTLLIAQDPRRFDLERADSLFDQRHRFVFSGVLAAPDSFRSEGGLKRVLADFIVAPIFEISSGRPFNILTGIDTNNDQSNQTDRPSVLADGTLCAPGATGCTPLITNGQFSTGSLGRNRGITRSYASLDLRVTRAVRFGDRIRLDVIAEGFNLFNRFNQAAASPLFQDVNAFNQRDGGGRYFSRPTASFDPRQFQFGLKLNF